MPFTHYPKLVWNLLFAWRWPAPPSLPGFLGQPSFASSNLMTEPLAPGKSFTAYHEAQNFTRFMGSFASDQKLLITFCFSNDECDADGKYVSDANLEKLYYDVESERKEYDPEKQAASGKFFTLIYGRWLRVVVTNKGDKPTAFMRVYVRGSVF